MVKRGELAREAIQVAKPFLNVLCRVSYGSFLRAQCPFESPVVSIQQPLNKPLARHKFIKTIHL